MISLALLILPTIILIATFERALLGGSKPLLLVAFIADVAAYDGGNAFRNFKVTGSGESTSSTGTGAENLAAGHRVLKCVKL